MSALVTRAQRFVVSGISYQVEAGTSCSTTLTAAGSILSGVNIILSSLIDEDEFSCQLVAIRTLVMQVEALIGAVEDPVRAAELLAPQNQTSAVRGAEVCQ